MGRNLLADRAAKYLSARETSNFSRRLAKWWSSNRRRFPWRETADPYALLIAEMMLRRTRASQVGPVFEEFLGNWPTVDRLAAAHPRDVAKALRPLGLEWRISAFTMMAKTIVSKHRGTVPADRDALLALPGVGDYVADAVRCFGYGVPTPVVDTNTVRVAGRYIGFTTGPESRRVPEVRRAVASLVDPMDPVNSNLALLDFAATICTARAPKCSICPVSEACAWVRTPRKLAERHAAVKDRA